MAGATRRHLAAAVGAPPPARMSRRPRLRPLTFVVAVGGLALSVVLALVAASVDHDSNRRLLQLQVRQAAAALGATVPSVQSQLGDALQVATDTGQTSAFRRFSATKIGARGEFVSISLWRRTGTEVHMVARVGTRPLLMAKGQARAFLTGISSDASLGVTGILHSRSPRLGYAEVSPTAQPMIVYAEVRLPSNHRFVVPRSSAFHDLNFALYLGSAAVGSQLIESSIPTPAPSLEATATVPFGSTKLTIVGTPTNPLAGSLSAELAWIVLLVGAVLSLGSAATVEYVSRRRVLAEALAEENAHLYLEQRDLATTLQHALLPEVPAPEAVEVAARYLPGVEGIDVGGDWYDVICEDEARCVFAVGDVSGRGLEAATTMASLRFAARAYLAQGDPPESVIAKLSELLHFDDRHQFATVLIGDMDVEAHRVTIASAGHFAPLLLGEETADFLEVPIGPPVGIARARRPGPLTVTVPPRATLLAFTDGLVERRGEHLDDSLERLRKVALESEGSVEELLDQLVATLVPSGGEDDVVILGVRWKT